MSLRWSILLTLIFLTSNLTACQDFVLYQGETASATDAENQLNDNSVSDATAPNPPGEIGSDSGVINPPAANKEAGLTPPKVDSIASAKKDSGTTNPNDPKSQYENQHLANKLGNANFAIRSGLAANELPALLQLLENVRRAFFEIMGPPFNTPAPTATVEIINVYIFATQAEYDYYMNTWIGGGAGAGGYYISGTLYTYQRTAAQDAFTLEDLIKHEITHALFSTYIMGPDYWSVKDPTSWANEGLAMYMQSVMFNADGSYAAKFIEYYRYSICNEKTPSLTDLIDGGIVYYHLVYSFSHFMFSNQKSAELNIYKSIRDRSYSIANFPTITGQANATLQTAWHNAISGWCTTTTSLPISWKSIDTQQHLHAPQLP